MFSVMILSITGEILQKTVSYVIYCLVMISVMDSIHHWWNFTKYNFLCYLFLVMISVMILSITG